MDIPECRREVVDDLLAADSFVHYLLIRDRADDDPGPALQVAGRRAVAIEDSDIMALAKQPRNEVPAGEPGTAGDEDLHGISSPGNARGCRIEEMKRTPNDRSGRAATQRPRRHRVPQAHARRRCASSSR
jgi:hypothetical protein